MGFLKFISGFGSVLQLYDHNHVPTLSRDLAIGDIKEFGESSLIDTLNINKDIACAWGKTIEEEVKKCHVGLKRKKVDLKRKKDPRDEVM